MKSTWMRLGLVIVLALVGCSADDVTSPTALTPSDSEPLFAAPEGAGNNLSYPVIWSDGATKALRGEYGVTRFDGEFALVNDVPAYLQQDPLNEWQAESAMGVAGGVDVSWIDWGDNLEARPWNENSVVRVEVVLTQDLLVPMTGYEMLFVSGLGVDEMWGASTATYLSDQATVYSGVARLTIQKLESVPPSTEPVITWNAELGQWEGDISAPFFNGGVWDATDGPSGFSAEINIKGKVVYGYNWRVNREGDGAGTYRLTFSLDPNQYVTKNTFFDTSQIFLPEEEVVEMLAEDDSGEPQGGVAYIDYENDLTWIDVQILPKQQGGGKGRNARH